jgi:hypothetical protein
MRLWPNFAHILFAGESAINTCLEELPITVPVRSKA